MIAQGSYLSIGIGLMCLVSRQEPQCGEGGGESGRLQEEPSSGEASLSMFGMV